MRAIIFGGAGFIGSELTARLTDRGADVVVADLVPPASLPSGAAYEFCDVRDEIKVLRDEPFDRVINLAAVHRTPGHPPSEYYETNVLGAQNVVDWCQSGGESSVEFTSSIAVYGPSESPKDESSVPTPNSDYGRSKLIAERIHRRWQWSQPGRQLVVIRPAVVFGPGEHGNFTRLGSALSRRRFMYAGRSDVIKSCGYVTDLVAALDFAHGLGRPELTVNFCYPDRYTIEEICRAFHKVAGYQLPRTVPPVALKAVMAVLGAVNPSDRGTLSRARVAKLTASTNIVPDVLVSEGFTWPTDLEGGLAAWQRRSPDGQFV